MNVTVDNKRAFDPQYEDYPVDFPVFANESRLGPVGPIAAEAVAAIGRDEKQ